MARAKPRAYIDRRRFSNIYIHSKFEMTPLIFFSAALDFYETCLSLFKRLLRSVF
jgi:hypothetical protein